MGYTVFTVVTRDGSELPFVCGNAIDFPQWPSGVKPSEVTAVKPHHGREHFRDRGPSPTERVAPYYWCIYAAVAG